MKSWFGLETRGQVVAHIAKHPGRIADVIDQRFIVELEWLDKGLRCCNGQRELDAWPVGTQGIVCSLKFTSVHGWAVVVEHEDDSLDEDQFYVEIPVGEFIRCTSPFNDVIPSYFRKKESANDGEVLRDNC